MTTRSHWASIAIFFACGVLVGIAAIVVNGSQRQVQALKAIRALMDAAPSTNLQDLHQNMMSGQLEADLTLLELSAAGRSDEAIESAAQRTKQALLRLSYEKGQGTSRNDMRATRFEDWQAGAAWVHEKRPDGGWLITPPQSNDAQAAAESDSD